jgi:hypothetical protein
MWRLAEVFRVTYVPTPRKSVRVAELAGCPRPHIGNILFKVYGFENIF